MSTTHVVAGWQAPSGLIRHGPGMGTKVWSGVIMHGQAWSGMVHAAHTQTHTQTHAKIHTQTNTHGW